MYVTSDKSLPISLDVQISLSMAAAAARKNLTVLCVAGENLGFLPNSQRVRFYSTLDSVVLDFATNSEAYQAAAAFFAQVNPGTMAIGEVFTEDLPAQLVSAELSAAQLLAIKAISYGSMALTYNNGGEDILLTLSDLDFSACTTIEAIAAVIDAAIDHLEEDVSCSVKTLPGGAKILVIQTTLAGTGKTITYPLAIAPVDAITNLITAWTNGAAPFDTLTSVASPNIAAAINTAGTAETAHSNAITLEEGIQYRMLINLTSNSGQKPTLTGTGGFPTTTLVAGENVIEFVATGDECVITATNSAAASWAAAAVSMTAVSVGTYMGTLLGMTAAAGGFALNGYTAVDIADELSSIQSAANAAGQFIYGWCLGASLRDVAIQTVAATWALGQRAAMMTLVSNDLTALSSGYTADLGPVLLASGNKRVVAIYHDNPQRYPDVSILAYMLSVNYMLQNSTVTAKFKVLPGIETVQLSETDLLVLQAKGYNVYTAVGVNARTYRDGVTDLPGWYMDTVINLDNFAEDLSVNVFNVFLRNKKVPFSGPGQLLLVDACMDTGSQYVYNGSFADRQITDTSKKSGISIVPAVQVIPTPINMASAADRSGRIGPPITIIVQDAGAIHEIAIGVSIVE
jgi:hypothetical protein